MTLDQVQEALATLPENEVFLLGVVMCTSSGVYYAVLELGNEATDLEVEQHDELLDVLYACEKKVQSLSALLDGTTPDLLNNILLLSATFGIMQEDEVQTIFGYNDAETDVEYKAFCAETKKAQLLEWQDWKKDCLCDSLPPCDAVVCFGIYI